MTNQLNNFAYGKWIPGEEKGQELVNAINGDFVASASSKGIDFAKITQNLIENSPTLANSESYYKNLSEQKIKEQEQVLDIGAIDSVEYTPNYMNDEELFLKAVVDSYKDNNNGKESKT